VNAADVLEFPTDYPLKVIGRPADEWRARVHAIMLGHVPALEPGRASERLSANGNFVSLSYLLPAESRAQIEALVRELQACEGVVMLL
jgi:putative lipoic acid-binding regulatory protein